MPFADYQIVDFDKFISLGETENSTAVLEKESRLVGIFHCFNPNKIELLLQVHVYYFSTFFFICLVFNQILSIVYNKIVNSFKK